MSGTVPYLGSKISLISKAEIRYEGVLYTIDPKESTVALAKVKSFGTEDRPTDRPVPPRDEIFEYIIFRGRDIKDLHVCAPPQMVGLPQDPAIVQSSEPAVLGGVGLGLPNQSSSFGSPTYPAGVELPGYAGPIGRQPPPGLQLLPQQLAGQIESEKSPASSQLPFASPKSHVIGSDASLENSPQTETTAFYDPVPGGAFDHQRENYRFQLSRRPPPRPHQSQGLEFNNRIERPHLSYGSEYSSRNHGYSYSSGNYNRNQGYQTEYSKRNRHGPPRGGGGMRGGNRPPRSRGSGNRGDSGLHFDGEFDFESSNAKFDKEQIEKELREKLTIGEKGDGDRKASGEEEEEEEEEDAAPAPLFYDKSKSFFDSISCEALDKSREGGRPNWKEERKMNVETFGMSGGGSYNRHGGRGRGRGYYTRGRGGGAFGSMYRGGYGYRGPTHNRNQQSSFMKNGSEMMAART